ncbi:MAG: hypothetical protein ACRYGK_15995, partial [Janthinobacterium lividum]
LQKAIAQIYRDLESRGDDIPETAMWDPEPVVHRKLALHAARLLSSRRKEHLDQASSIANQFFAITHDEQIERVNQIIQLAKQL